MPTLLPAATRARKRAAIQRDIVQSWPSILVRAISKGAVSVGRATLPAKPGLLQRSLKTIKGEKLGFDTGILYLSPALESGRDTCAWRSLGCTRACLKDSGQLSMPPGLNSRLWKTALYFGARALFFELLAAELLALQTSAKRKGMRAACRLDGTSDLGIALQRYNGKPLHEHFPGVMFYDYSKSPKRALVRASNYHCTFSYSGSNGRDARKVLQSGGNVAVAFNALPAIKGRRDADTLPATWRGFAVIDGDETDARWTDPSGVVVGLRFKASKGRASKLRSAGRFVQPNKAS